MEHLRPWFRLKSAHGIGALLCKRLLDRFGSPQAVFDASAAELCRVEGVAPRLAEALLRHRTPAWVGPELELAARRGYRILTLFDPDYPPLLREIPDPPSLLYRHGPWRPEMRAIAVVGSRNATVYGLAAARRLSAELAESGFTVVSGLARGIDAAAHAGALDAGGHTVAVLGSGLENPYPPENRSLAQRIALAGALFSEFALQAEPAAHHFPVRNRIISGLTLGTLVVEATRSSGSLITARLAAEQNREVFAVPGSVTSFKSMGTHGLIRQGAKLVACAREIIEELPPIADNAPCSGMPPRPQSSPPQPTLPAEEALVFGAMTPYAQHIDDLVRQLHIDPGPLCAILLRLELKDLVSRAPGNFFTLTSLS